MNTVFVVLVLICIINFVKCQDCRVNIVCDECYPDHLPVITSHDAKENVVTISHGHEATFHCHKTKFKLYPNNNTISVICDSGAFRTLDDLFIKEMSDLGCQADYFEDVPHHADSCPNSYQGRSYQFYDTALGDVQHLVEMCCDPERGRTLFTHMTLSNNNSIIRSKHQDSENKLSYLETFSHMTDNSHRLESEKVYSSDELLNLKFKNLVGRHVFNFADQSLTITKLLPPSYFHNQNGRITKYPSNKIAMWKSIANGNIKHIQDDILTTFLYNKHKNESNYIDVYVGTYETLTLPVRNKQQEMYLKPGKKYPVPKYVYTIVYDKEQHKAIALVVVNNPFVSISEIRSTVFCTSVCSLVNWLQNLKFNNNYERMTYGLVFCCDLHSFANTVAETPNILGNVHAGEKGLLKNVR